MKRMLLCVFAGLLIVASLAACDKPASGNDVEVSAPSVGSDVETPSQESESPEPEVAPVVPGNPIMVADAAKYRGTATQLTLEGEVLTVTLERYAGTNFGAATMKFVTDENTRSSVPLESLAVGDYLEVFYGGMGADIDPTATITAIGINNLGSAEARVYNGVVQEISPNAEKPEEGKIRMLDMDGANEVVFNYQKSGETQFYMNFDAIEEGTELSIFHDLAMTRSLPPQVFALEVNPYFSPDGESSSTDPAIPPLPDGGTADAISPELESIV